MKLINKLYKPTIGLIPIAAHYTMDMEDASFAIKNYFDFKLAIPIHFNIFDSIIVDLLDNSLFDELYLKESK